VVFSINASVDKEGKFLGRYKLKNKINNKNIHHDFNPRKADNSYPKIASSRYTIPLMHTIG